MERTMAKKKEVKISNRVKEICDKRGLDRQEFIGLCLLSKVTYEGRRLTPETAGRVYDGTGGIGLGTYALVAIVLDVPIEDLFTIEN
jgi:hypothetical protein